MNIETMHYLFNRGLSKSNSSSNRSYRIPEIDLFLNEAQNILIQSIAQPRQRNGLGFEINQRAIDELRTIVVNQTMLQGTCSKTQKLSEEEYYVSIPVDYLYYINSKLIASKGTCTNKILTTHVQQHDDLFGLSSFDKSNFGWRQANITFYEEGIKIHTNGDFIPSFLCINYIRKPAYMHYAQGVQGGSYVSLDGNTLTGKQDCELPIVIRNKIVDMAILIASGEAMTPDMELKIQKYKLSE